MVAGLRVFSASVKWKHWPETGKSVLHEPFKFFLVGHFQVRNSLFLMDYLSWIWRTENDFQIWISILNWIGMNCKFLLLFYFFGFSMENKYIFLNFSGLFLLVICFGQIFDVKVFKIRLYLRQFLNHVHVSVSFEL